VNACKDIESDIANIEYSYENAANAFIINLQGAYPVVGPILVAGLAGVEKLMDDGNEALNGVIDAVNGKLDQINACMGQQLSAITSQDIDNEIQAAMLKYDLARNYVDGGNSDEKEDLMREAWTQFIDVALTRFDDVYSEQGYSGLLPLLQKFRKYFLDVSLAYLWYVHDNDPTNYDWKFERTVRAFEQVQTLAEKAHAALYAPISNEVRALHCNSWSGGVMDEELEEWSTVFKNSHIHPIDNDIRHIEEEMSKLTE